MNYCGKHSICTTPIWSVLFLLVMMGRVAGSAEMFCPLLCVCNFDLLAANCSGIGLFDIQPVVADRSYNWTESLSFSVNFISAVEDDTLSHFPHLLDLSLADNAIRDITNGSFGLLKDRLHRLILGGNMLTEIPAAIRRLSALRELDLSRNNLGYVAGDSFEGLVMLESLNLDRNSIHVFDGTAFHALNSLSKLSLTENFLAEDPVGWFEDCPLRELYLSYNAVPLDSEVRSWFGTGEAAPLEHLVLIDNGIKTITDGHFRGMVNLITLDLGRNKIRTITKASTEGLSNLNELIINSNLLQSIDRESFQDMLHLKVLSIDENKLVSLPAGLFSASKQLTRLNAANNNLKDISAITDEYLPEVIELYLYSNAIQHIASQGFTSLPMLSKLVAGGNLFTHVPNVTNLPELQTLELSRNEIQSISAHAFRGSHSLREIFLEHNQLEFLKYETFAQLFYLERLALFQNPWWCDCRVEWLLDLAYSEEAPFWINDVQEFYCFNPPALKGQPLMNLVLEDLVLRCPNIINRNVILALLGAWFSVILFLLVRFWCRKFSTARKTKKIGKRNDRYKKRRGRSNGIFGGHLKGHHPGNSWSDSYALILQNKDNDEQDGCGNGISGDGKINRGERVEIARVTTV